METLKSVNVQLLGSHEFVRVLCLRREFGRVCEGSVRGGVTAGDQLEHRFRVELKFVRLEYDAQIV